jgi:hypothetical protein
MLDRDNHAEICPATDVFRTSHLESLYVVSPLSVPSDFVCNYVARSEKHPMHQLYRAAFHPTTRDSYQFLTSAPRPAGRGGGWAYSCPYYPKHTSTNSNLGCHNTNKLSAFYQVGFRRNLSFHIPSVFRGITPTVFGP